MSSNWEQWLVQTLGLCFIALGLFRAGSRLEIGWKRGICAIVIVVLNTLMPLWYDADDLLVRTIAIFQFTWLCNFKVLHIFLPFWCGYEFEFNLNVNTNGILCRY